MLRAGKGTIVNNSSTGGLRDETPAERFGAMDQIAETVDWLLRIAPADLNGAVIPIDSGRTARACSPQIVHDAFNQLHAIFRTLLYPLGFRLEIVDIVLTIKAGFLCQRLMGIKPIT